MKYKNTEDYYSKNRSMLKNRHRDTPTTSKVKRNAFFSFIGAAMIFGALAIFIVSVIIVSKRHHIQPGTQASINGK